MELGVAGIVLRLWLLNILMVTDWSNAASVSHKDLSQSLIGGQGLYNASDDVVILNATNFKVNVYGSAKGWLVEFYNSWCGFCYRFAPTWKTLANDILSWNDIIVVAAIDCADDDNNPICREHEIMHYPMLKYFSVNAHPPSLGIIIEKGDSIDAVRHNLVSRLEMEQQEGRGSTWPNIAPYRRTNFPLIFSLSKSMSTVKYCTVTGYQTRSRSFLSESFIRSRPLVNMEIMDIWKTTSSNVKYFFLIFEDANSHLGTEVILDLHRIISLQIRRVTSENELLCVTNKITKFPTLVAFSRNESQKIINIRIPTRQGIRKAIKDYVITRGVNIDDAVTTISHDIQSENTHRTTIVTTTKFQQEMKLLRKADDYLHQLDLENALRYSINHEIPLTKSIGGEKMEALQKYLVILAAYFPLRQSNTYLEILRDIIRNKNYITGEEFSQLVKTTEKEMSPVYSGSRQWLNCKGSKDSYRGYPCGLWTMFHMLTVNFAIENRDGSQTSLQDPAAVLRAMHAYISTFFGCADCAAHFMDMATRNKIFEVHSKNEGVLWLWRAHNEVNARLSGDDTEDPDHKKIQYPSAKHCVMCKFDNGSWNEDEVLRYLKTKYSYNGIRYDGIRNDNDDTITGNRSGVRSERLAKENERTASDWDFNIFDISICVILYVVSAAILVLVCVKFAVKRTYKKKGHINLLGKV